MENAEDFAMSQPSETESAWERGFQKGQQLARKSIRHFVMDHVEEVTNDIGGVIGYTLTLNDEETEKLLKSLE